MEYRSAEVRERLEKVGREASMFHMDVLLLVYHFARFAAGNILEIGPHIGGFTIAAAFGACESVTRKKIVSIEAGGRLKHFRLSSRDIIQDFKKNLARFDVAEDVFLINGRSFEEATISEVRRCLSLRDIGLFIFDADNNVRRDLDCYGDLLTDACWLVIDDYLGRQKQRRSKRRLTCLCRRGGFFRLAIMDGARGLVSGSASSSLRAKQKGPHLPRLSKLLCALADKKR